MGAVQKYDATSFLTLKLDAWLRSLVYLMWNRGLSGAEVLHQVKARFESLSRNATKRNEIELEHKHYRLDFSPPLKPEACDSSFQRLSSDISSLQGTPYKSCARPIAAGSPSGCR